MTSLLILSIAAFYVWAIYHLMQARSERRRLQACGLDYYMPKHLLQKQLDALHLSIHQASADPAERTHNPIWRKH